MVKTERKKILLIHHITECPQASITIVVLISCKSCQNRMLHFISTPSCLLACGMRYISSFIRKLNYFESFKIKNVSQHYISKAYIFILQGT